MAHPDDDATADPARPATRGPAARVLREGASWGVARGACGVQLGGGGSAAAEAAGRASVGGWVDGWMDGAREFTRPA